MFYTNSPPCFPSPYHGASARTMVRRRRTRARGLNGMAPTESRRSRRSASPSSTAHTRTSNRRAGIGAHITTTIGTREVAGVVQLVELSEKDARGTASGAEAVEVVVVMTPSGESATVTAAVPGEAAQWLSCTGKCKEAASLYSMAEAVKRRQAPRSPAARDSRGMATSPVQQAAASPSRREREEVVDSARCWSTARRHLHWERMKPGGRGRESSDDTAKAGWEDGGSANDAAPEQPRQHAALRGDE